MATLEFIDKENDLHNESFCSENQILDKSKDTSTFIEGIYNSADCKIINKRMEVLEHGELKCEEVKGIVLHQTNGQTAMSTMARYHKDNAKNIIVAKILGRQAVKGIGAHFLISPGGTIYQTARVDRICYHVGAYINSLCHERRSCDKEQEDRHKIIMNDSEMDDEDKWKAITDIEIKKPWHERYPKNSDSIGIEIVGMPPDGEHYPKPSAEQVISSRWLVGLLLKNFNLNCDRVFAHGQTSPHKKSSEGLHLALDMQKECSINL